MYVLGCTHLYITNLPELVEPMIHFRIRDHHVIMIHPIL